MYYPCSENKGVDQLRGYREADLRLCFRICQNRFSHDAAHIYFSWVVVGPGEMLTVISAGGSTNNRVPGINITNQMVKVGAW